MMRPFLCAAALVAAAIVAVALVLGIAAPAHAADWFVQVRVDTFYLGFEDARCSSLNERNYGADTSLAIGRDGSQIWRTWMDWDWTATTLATDAKIDSCFIEVYLDTVGAPASPAADTIQVFHSLRLPLEGTKTGMPSAAADSTEGVSYVNYRNNAIDVNPDSAWATPGAGGVLNLNAALLAGTAGMVALQLADTATAYDRTTCPCAVAKATAQGSRTRIRMTECVNPQRSGPMRPWGWIWKGNTETAGNFVRFYSSEYNGDTTKRPRMIVHSTRTKYVPPIGPSR
jgi:hypothetical protein